jgi:hypothetical protein
MTIGGRTIDESEVPEVLRVVDADVGTQGTAQAPRTTASSSRRRCVHTSCERVP